MSKRLTGLNPLAYLGVEPLMPPNMYMAADSPTSTDVRGFNIGDFWVNTTAQTLWVLVSQAGGIATWIPLFGGASDVFMTDSGTATPSGGIVKINGDALNISTSAPGPSNIVKITLNPDLTLTGLTLTGFTGGVLTSNGSGVIGEVATTNHSLLVGNSAGTISSLGVATNGQIPIGSTGASPVLATITQGSGVTVTNGAGTITISATGSGGSVTSLTEGTGITLSPSTITTTGSIGLTVPVVVANGGTGDTSFTAYSVITGGTTSTGVLQNVSGVGTSGQILVSNGAGALPSWQDNAANIPLTTTITLTSAQIKLLATTPITVISAPGSNKTINILSVVSSFNYGGNNAFTPPSGGSSTTIWLFYNINSTNVRSSRNFATQVSAEAQYTDTASSYSFINSTFGGIISPADAVDTPIIVGITSDNTTEIGGNASGDNTISIQVTYEIVPVPL